VTESELYLLFHFCLYSKICAARFQLMQERCDQPYVLVLTRSFWPRIESPDVGPVPWASIVDTGSGRWVIVSTTTAATV